MIKIRLFIKPYCGWCHKAVRRLAAALEKGEKL
jgi:predicted DsbA family dithiol-disulfide isomerase